MNKYYIPQIGNGDCGFAAMKMMVARLYEDENALYIKHDESKTNYSFQELKDEASKYGVNLLGVEINSKEALKEFKLPFIALLKISADVYHYVLVTKISFKTIYYSDPSEGDCSLSENNFMSIWTGKALIIEDFEKLDITFSNNLPKQDKGHFFTLILQVMSALFLVFGIYFVNEQSNIYIPIIFLALFLITEIILRTFLVKRMERLDIDYLPSVNLDKKKYHLFYRRYEEYKSGAITSKMNLVFIFISIIFLAVITLLNNIYNAFIILVPLLLAIIDTKYIDGVIKSKMVQIEFEENEINGIKNIDMFKSQMKTIHKRGYQIAKVMLLKKYIYMSIILLTSLLTITFNETFSLPFLIFYFFIGYTLFEQYSNFMNYPLKQREFLISKVKLNNVITDL